MKLFPALIAYLGILFASSPLPGDVKEVKPVVSASFGKAQKMAGTVRRNTPDDRLKDPGPEWFIEVTEVAGTKLKKPVRIVFSNETGDQTVNLKVDGLALEFAAYESGNFRGIPDDYSKFGDAWADVGFHFQNRLVIVKIIK